MKSKTGEDRLHFRAQHELESLEGSEGITPMAILSTTGQDQS